MSGFETCDLADSRGADIRALISSVGATSVTEALNLISALQHDYEVSVRAVLLLAEVLTGDPSVVVSVSEDNDGVVEVEMARGH